MIYAISLSAVITHVRRTWSKAWSCAIIDSKYVPSGMSGLYQSHHWAQGPVKPAIELTKWTFHLPLYRHERRPHLKRLLLVQEQMNLFKEPQNLSDNGWQWGRVHGLWQTSFHSIWPVMSTARARVRLSWLSAFWMSKGNLMTYQESSWNRRIRAMSLLAVMSKQRARCYLLRPNKTRLGLSSSQSFILTLTFAPN